MRKIPALLVAALALSIVTAAAQAHELRVVADPYQVASPGERTTVFLSWGHSLADDNPVAAETLERYDLIAPGGSVSPLAREGLAVQANARTLSEPGVYQVAASRQATVLTYVRDAEGNRLMRRGPKSSVTEGDIDYGQRSQHTAKALLVAGTPGAGAVEPAGLPLEIVPLDGPDRWRAGRTIRFQVLFDGQPADRELLLAAYDGFEPEEAWCYAIQTDGEGVAPLRADQPGLWTLLVRVRKLADEATRPEYDYESTTTTLTMPIRP